MPPKQPAPLFPTPQPIHQSPQAKPIKHPRPLNPFVCYRTIYRFTLLISALKVSSRWVTHRYAAISAHLLLLRRVRLGSIYATPRPTVTGYRANEYQPVHSTSTGLPELLSLPSLSQSHRSLAHTALVTALPILANGCSVLDYIPKPSNSVSSSMPATNAKTGTCRGSRSLNCFLSACHETEMTTQATFTKITSSCSWKLSKA